jgi:DNA-binding response OmpR family regulator
VTTVLVVDDEPAVRDVVVRYLEAAGYRALQAADGYVAREVLDAETPSLVILDLMLPGLDRLSLCKEIRSRSGPSAVAEGGEGREALQGLPPAGELMLCAALARYGRCLWIGA